MKYNKPFDAVDANAPYVNGNPSTGTPGSIPPAAAFEHPQREIVNALEGFGITPNEGNLYQLLEAMRRAGMGKNVTVYDTAGTFTFVVPNGVYALFGECWGGGGGGCGYINRDTGEGGGGGGYAAGWISVTPGQNITITVGAAGAAGSEVTTSLTNGGNGGTSSIGAFMSATGGNGAIVSSGTPGTGGTGTGGQIRMAGQDGGDGWPSQRQQFSPGGDAGGPGGKGATNFTPKRPGAWPGGGGAGFGHMPFVDTVYTSAGAAGGVILRY